MRIVPNTGTDRVIDLVRPWLKAGHRVDLASGALSLIAYGELAGSLPRMAGVRLILPPDSTELEFLGSAAARQVAAERDAKLGELRRVIERKSRHPVNPGNRKTIVFTAFAETAYYLPGAGTMCFAALRRYAATVSGLQRSSAYSSRYRAASSATVDSSARFASSGSGTGASPAFASVMAAVNTLPLPPGAHSISRGSNP